MASFFPLGSGFDPTTLPLVTRPGDGLKKTLEIIFEGFQTAQTR